MTDTVDTAAAVADDTIVTSDAGLEGSGADVIDKGMSETDTSDEGVEASETDSTDVNPETKEDLKEAVEDAIEAGASEEEIKDMIEEFEIKVNGKTKKVRVDLNNKEDLKKQIQLAEAGRLSMQELAELKKAVNQTLMEAKDDPWSFLENELGLDTEALLEQRLEHVIEQKKKSPEQLEKEKMLSELEQERAARERLEKESKDREYQNNLQRQYTDLNNQIVDALSKDNELPKVPKTVRRIAEAMLKAMNKGIPDITVSDVLPYVKSDIKSEIQEFMASMPEEMVEAYLGSKTLDRLRKRRLAQAKKAPKDTVAEMKDVTVDKSQDEKEDVKLVKSKDFFRNL